MYKSVDIYSTVIEHHDQQTFSLIHNYTNDKTSCALQWMTNTFYIKIEVSRCLNYDSLKHGLSEQF